jgi:CO/xanthine dehydrogenase Mo-binding subunit
VRDEVAELLSMPADRIHVHPRMASGTYGRNNVGDAALDAVRLSRAAGCPVLVTWSRADEFRRSPHRPELDAELRAALDEQGRIVAWHSDVRTNPHTHGGMVLLPQIAAMTAGRNAVPPYEIGRAKVALRVAPAEIRTAPFRSLAASPHVFAIESFIDELAELVNADPIDFRLRHVTDPRLRRVLETVRVQSGWSTRKKLDNHGLGVACAIYHGTYVAEVAELTVAPSGAVHLERVFCVADPGPLVHPDGGKNQLEGAIVQAASVTLLERLATRRGAISSSSFEDYPIARFDDAPREIDVTFTPEPGVPSTGLGEPGCVPAAAAIANAVYAATGVRVRSLPISAEAIRSRPS